MTAGKWYKYHRDDLPGCNLAAHILFNQRQLLGLETGTHRYYHGATILKLPDKGRRNMTDRCSHNNTVKRCMFRPAIIAVSYARCYIVIAKVL